MNARPFLTQLQQGKIRQFAISGSSLFAAALCVIFTSPAMIGGFAYYTIVLLLTCNAILALLQFQQIIRPVARLLEHVNEVTLMMNDADIVRIERLPVSDGDVFGCLAAGLDTVLEALFGRLAARNERIRSLEEMLTALPVSIIVLTRDFRVARIFNANGLGDSLQGYRIGEEPDVAFWGEAGVATMRAMHAAALRGPTPQWNTLTVNGGDSPRSYRTCMRRINQMSTLVMTLDVTESGRQAAAEAAPRSDSAMAQRAALRRMAASIAHDGKNIFAALSNLVEINRGSSDPSVRDQIPLASDAIARGAALMKELSGFAGDTRMQFHCLPAREFLDGILRSPSIQALLPDNISLHLDFTHDGLPQVDADPEQFWKVFFNLVKNSVEAMTGAGGRIIVRALPFEMTDEAAKGFRHSETLRRGKGLLVTLSDDGRGIPTAMTDRIFDPYSSSKGEGRGIGLATVTTIIDAHGGAISAKSSSGRGTVFSIFLPVSRNTEEELSMVRSVAPNGELLLVDGDDTILHTTGLVLRSLKIAAHPASTAADAMSKLIALRNRLRAVVVDANIDCASSAPFVQAVKNEFPRLPVIVVSGAPQEDVDQAFDGVTYDRFLSKPYSAGELSQALDDVSSRP